jgi:hypothetical protein
VLLPKAERPALTDLPHPYPFPYDIQTILHFIFPVLRILLLIPLFFALINPIVTYTSITSSGVFESEPVSTSLLLPPEAGINTSTGLTVGSAIKYGTFHSTASAATTVSVPATSPQTPDRGAAKVQVGACIASA